MVQATLTSKGQITVPKAVRERLNLQTGSKLYFVVKDDHVEVTSVGGDIMDWYGSLGAADSEELDVVKLRVMEARAEEVVREGADG